MIDIDAIVNKLKIAASAYYNSGESLISDQEYDDLKKQLEQLDPDNEYLKEVGSPPTAGHLSLATHSIPMGSQMHATTDQMFWDWWEKTGQPEVVISQKIDGSSIGAYYDNGKLVQVITRGDGKQGQVVTDNAVKWAGLPHKIKLKGKVAIRGEAVLLKKVFEEHFSDSANPRNAGNGIIVRKSGEDNEHIVFRPFDIDSGMEYATQVDKFEHIESLGFVPVGYSLCTNKEEIIEAWDYYNKTRDQIAFEMDGAVVYINDIKAQEAQGIRDGRPKGQIAFKFPPQEGQTIVEDIEITMGHTGALIPTAVLKPIKLAGVTISHALLTTFSRIKDLNVNIGDQVLIRREGDVIPNIIKVVIKNSKGPFPAPTSCPSCKKTLAEEGAYVICTYDKCPSKEYQAIMNWITKTGIKHLGDSLLQQLFNTNVINKISDLYSVDWDNLADTPRGAGRLGESMAARIKAQINSTRTMELYKFIGSIGIKGLGRRQAEIMGLKKVDEFLNLTEEEAAKLPQVGEVKAKIIVDSINNNRHTIQSLLKFIKVVEPVEKVKVAGQKSFCLTGKMTRSRKQIEADIIAAGHIPKDDVAAGLDYLVSAETDSTSSKAKKANKLGVKIITEEQLMEILR